jgi:hypothetical protein
MRTVKFAAQWTSKRINQFDLNDVKISTDSEPSVMALAQEVETLLEDASEADHHAISVGPFHRMRVFETANARELEFDLKNGHGDDHVACTTCIVGNSQVRDEQGISRR